MQTLPIIPPQDKLKTTAEVVEWCAENDLPADSTPAARVWLKFPEKPDKAVRAAIKAGATGRVSQNYASHADEKPPHDHDTAG